MGVFKPAAGGKVLQVVRRQWTAAFTTTSVGWVVVPSADFNFKPRSGMSVLFMMADISIYLSDGGKEYVGGSLRLMSDSGTIPIFTPADGYETYISTQIGAGFVNGLGSRVAINGEILAKNTASRVMGLDARTYTAGNKMEINSAGLYQSSITVMEIEI